MAAIAESTISLLSCLPECHIPQTAPKLPLGARMQILLEVLPRYPGSDYCELRTCLEEAGSLMSKRAVVASNVVTYGYQQIKGRGETGDSVRSRPPGRLSVDEVKELAGTAEGLAKRVGSATDRLQAIHGCT